MKIIIHRDFPFLGQWRAIQSTAAEALSLGFALRSVVDALAQGRRPGSSPELGEVAQGDAVPYDLGAGQVLITLQAGTFVVLYAVGDREWARRWLQGHAEVRMLVEITGELVRVFVRGDVEVSDFEWREAEELGEREGPLLARISGIDWRREIGHRGLARRLMAWRKDDDVGELHGALDELERHKGSSDLPDLITTLIYYLQAGRADEAVAAAQDWAGTGSLIEIREQTAAVPEGSWESQADPEQMAVLNHLSEADISRLLGQRFQDWMQFLHREQKRIVEEDYALPVLLRGVSGSGKTVVLVHRACRLARRNPESRVLALAPHHDLAMLIYDLVSQLAGDDGLANLRVLSFSGYLRQFIQQTGYDESLRRWEEYLQGEAADAPRLGPAYRDELFSVQKDFVYAGRFREFLSDQAFVPRDLRKALERLLRKVDLAEYLRDELDYVRSAANCWNGYQEYLRVERQGRSLALQGSSRQRILELTRAWERYQWAHGFVDPSTMAQMVRLLVEEGRRIPEELRFDHVLVDEYQDLSTLEIGLLAALPASGQNGLFLTGDDAQRVRVKRLRLAEALMTKPVNRSIRKNYRNTVEVLQAANALVGEAERELARSFGDSGEGFELLQPQYSNRHGPKPLLIKSADPIAEAWRVALDRAGQGVPACSICLVTMNELAIPLRTVLAGCPAGRKAELLTGGYLQEPQRFVVSDVLGVKGFEFTHVLILGAEDGVLPRPGMPKGEHWRDVLRLYSVMTRAQNQVAFFYRRKPSALLKPMKAHLG